MKLEDILKKPEGQCFDRKRALIQPNDLADCVMSFANTDGGEIAVGIEDDGTPSGFIDCLDKESEIRESLSNYIYPPMLMTISKIPFKCKRGDNFILLISVEPSLTMNRNRADKVTQRIGRQTHYLKYDEIRHL
jgi:ATP-dependent DNA helicase RecG